MHPVRYAQGCYYRICHMIQVAPGRIRQEAWAGAVGGASLAVSMVALIALYVFTQAMIEVITRSAGLEASYLYFPEDCQLEPIRALDFTLCNVPEFAQSSTKEALMFAGSITIGLINAAALFGMLIGVIIGIASSIFARI